MKLAITFLKDLKLSFRTFYIYIEILMAVIFVAILLFVVPENFQGENKIFASIDLEPAMKEQLISAMGSEMTSITLLESETAVRGALEDNRDSSGLVISLTGGKLNYEFVLQGYESEKAIKLMEKGFTAALASEMPQYRSVTTVTTLDSSVEKLPDRINLLPLFLVMNSSFIGMYIISSYIFLDKEEGTIKAIAVTPATVAHYLQSKMGIMLLTGLITGLITVLAVAGFKVHIIHFLVFLIICNAFGSALGLLISSFYDTMIKAFGTLYVVIIIFGLTAVSYFTPSFSPIYIRLLPSYPMLYAFRETLSEKPDLAYIYTWAGVFAILAVIIFLAAERRFRKTITV